MASHSQLFKEKTTQALQAQGDAQRSGCLLSATLPSRTDLTAGVHVSESLLEPEVWFAEGTKQLPGKL